MSSGPLPPPPRSLSTSEGGGASAGGRPHLRPQRVLACILCQQRKIKCDRQFPCAHCVRAKATCVPAAQIARRRRRRFPERDLLERIRAYEKLLRQNNVAFEPLHAEHPLDRDRNVPGEARDVEDQHQSETPSEHVASKSEVHEPVKDFWHAMSQGYQSSDCESDCSDNDLGTKVAMSSWHQLFLESDEHPSLLGPSCSPAMDLSALHPEPVLLFRLWQAYLDNVNPLLKVSHTPSLQSRVVDAAGRIACLGDANFEVLLFGIYCAAVASVDDECEAVFGEARDGLLARFQFGCRQALLNAAFLRTTSLECVTGFFLYLISMRPTMHPRSLSSLCGIALRAAQRIGLHRESLNAACPAFEAEARRRLWWSLVTFDARVGELADGRANPLDPTWDCRVPLNLNDADLQPSMSAPVSSLSSSGPGCTDAIFAVVRHELADFVRRAPCYLDFINPALKPLAWQPSPSSTTSDKASSFGKGQEATAVEALARTIEDKYLSFCDTRIPLHHTTVWTARATLAKYHFYAAIADAGPSQTPSQRDVILADALSWIESDTRVVAAPASRRFRWFARMYFPLPAYIRVFHDLRRRPAGSDAQRCWDAVSENYRNRLAAGEPNHEQRSANFVRILSAVVLQAWSLREEALPPREKAQVAVPFMVTHLAGLVAAQAEEKGPLGSSSEGASATATADMGLADLHRTMLTGDGMTELGSSTTADMAVTGPFGGDGSSGTMNSWGAALDWDFVDSSDGHVLY